MYFDMNLEENNVTESVNIFFFCERMVEKKRFIKDGVIFLHVAEVLNITHFYKILLLLSTTRSYFHV